MELGTQGGENRAERFGLSAVSFKHIRQIHCVSKFSMSSSL